MPAANRSFHEADLMNTRTKRITPERLPRFNESLGEGDLSLGFTQLALAGVPIDRDVVVSNSFIVGSSGNEDLVAIVPDPAGDVYLNQMCVQALSPGERCIVLPLIEGLADYYIARGVMHSCDQLIEVNPQSKRRFGFPDTDPLASLASGSICRGYVPSHALLISAFPGEESARQARRLGWSQAQPPIAGEINNKAYFRRVAERYQIPIPTGLELNNVDDVCEAIRLLANAPAAWLKLDKGSGGDLVIRVKAPLSAASIMGGIRKLQERFARAIQNNIYSKEVSDRYWPHGSDFPLGGVITIEEDLGPGLADAGAFVMNSREAEFFVPTLFSKIIAPDGSYLGGASFYPNEALLEGLRGYIARFCEMYEREFGYFGFSGIDFLISGDSVNPKITFYEWNGRIPVSGLAYLLARKLGCENWLNVNLTFPRPITSLGDAERMIGQDLLGGANIVPQAFRTQCYLAETGEREVIRASRRAKYLLCGASPGDCLDLAKRLERRGIKVG